MKDYSDIETFSQLNNPDQESLPSDLSEVIAMLDEDNRFEIWEAAAFNQESIIILYLPYCGRAGIAWGADASWTDCNSAQDALERYFGINGKEICN